MGKAARLVRGEAQKNVIKLMEQLTGRYSLWEVWQDFIIMSAISIANVFDGPHREAREREYHTHADKYTRQEMEVFADMLYEVTLALESNPDQDFLGDLFMSLDLGNQWRGQFFTPYHVCRVMAAMNFNDDLLEKINSQGFISVNDPACGAGALLVAFANECRRHPDRQVNYQTSVLFVAQDIDFLAGCMCYIQLSLLVCPGYVVVDDTLRNPITSHDNRGLLPHDGPQVWCTPMFYHDIWCGRRLWAQMDMMCRAAAPQVKAKEPSTEPLAIPEQPALETETTQSSATAEIEPVDAKKIPQNPFAERKNGQLTLF